jgi:hypothetical protein
LSNIAILIFNQYLQSFLGCNSRDCNIQLSVCEHRIS